MGILSSLLKTGLTVGAAAIPGAGPFVAPAVSAAFSGQPGILGKAAAAGGAIAGQQLGNALFKGGEEAVSQPLQKAAEGITFANNPDILTEFAMADLKKKMFPGGFFSQGF